MYWLGIDVGSISTDLVLIDEMGEVRASHYLKTGSRPTEAIMEGLRRLGRRCASEEVSGVGVTGSGRHLGAAIAGGDVVKNEITAHGRAVAKLDPRIRTVIEIGGQDSKIILMEDGLVSDFAMNTVCAAGTGSFLDRQAQRMGVSIQKLGDMAADADRHVSIAGRCAVFAESDMIHKQQEGAREEELMAGMCRALAAAYLSNVAKGKKIRERICFQGGVAANRGMKRAFEELLDCEIFVPREHKIMGALGAALLAKENKGLATRFNGFEVGRVQIDTEEQTCCSCSNHCRITVIVAQGKAQGYFGDRCGRYSG